MGLAQAYGQIGLCKVRLNQTDEAEENIFKALRILLKDPEIENKMDHLMDVLPISFQG